MRPKYQKEAAELCAWLDVKERYPLPSCWQDVSVIHADDEMAVAAYHRPTHTLHFAIRGTKEARQWLSNFDLRLTRITAFGHTWKAIRGFTDAAFAMYAQMKTAIHELEHKHVTTWVVSGHSRGAAVATLFVPLLHHHMLSVEEAHLFGSPRVFRSMTGKVFDNLYPWVYRWVNNNDTATRLPPKFLMGRHVGQLMYFDRFGGLCVSPGRIQVLKDRVLGRFQAWKKKDLLDGVTDHHMVREYKTLVNKERYYEEV